MSVAFVKEPNEDQVEVLPDRDLGTDPNIVTTRGLSMIRAEIEALEARRDAAQRDDDKVSLASINRDLRYWHARQKTAEVVDAGGETPDTVQFGTRIVIKRGNGRQQTFMIVGIDEADPGTGSISYLSPLARNLIGKEVGDMVRAGASDAEIVSISRS